MIVVMLRYSEDKKEIHRFIKAMINQFWILPA
jgi:hypothetical protein